MALEKGPVKFQNFRFQTSRQ